MKSKTNLQKKKKKKIQLQAGQQCGRGRHQNGVGQVGLYLINRVTARTYTYWEDGIDRRDERGTFFFLLVHSLFISASLTSLHILKNPQSLLRKEKRVSHEKDYSVYKSVFSRWVKLIRDRLIKSVKLLLSINLHRSINHAIYLFKNYLTGKIPVFRNKYLIKVFLHQ